jgi:hypothetical protein
MYQKRSAEAPPPSRARDAWGQRAFSPLCQVSLGRSEVERHVAKAYAMTHTTQFHARTRHSGLDDRKGLRQLDLVIDCLQFRMVWLRYDGARCISVHGYVGHLGDHVSHYESLK